MGEQPVHQGASSSTVIAVILLLTVFRNKPHVAMYAFIPTKLGKKNETETEIPQKHPISFTVLVHGHPITQHVKSTKHPQKDALRSLLFLCPYTPARLGTLLLFITNGLDRVETRSFLSRVPAKEYTR
jgi:hypothetical protein